MNSVDHLFTVFGFWTEILFLFFRFHHSGPFETSRIFDDNLFPFALASFARIRQSLIAEISKENSINDDISINDISNNGVSINDDISVNDVYINDILI